MSDEQKLGEFFLKILGYDQRTARQWARDMGVALEKELKNSRLVAEVENDIESAAAEDERVDPYHGGKYSYDRTAIRNLYVGWTEDRLGNMWHFIGPTSESRLRRGLAELVQEAADHELIVETTMMPENQALPHLQSASLAWFAKLGRPGKRDLQRFLRG